VDLLIDAVVRDTVAQQLVGLLDLIRQPFQVPLEVPSRRVVLLHFKVLLVNAKEQLIAESAHFCSYSQ